MTNTTPKPQPTKAGAKAVADKPITTNSWMAFTLSGLIGFIVALVAVTMSYSSTAHTAGQAQQRANDNAKEMNDDIRPRLRALEEWRAESREQYRTIISTLARIEKDVKGN